MPDGAAVYKPKVSDTSYTWKVDANYTSASTAFYAGEPAKKIPHMKCKSCGNIFVISDDLFDEDHCTFECKYNKSKSNANPK